MRRFALVALLVVSCGGVDDPAVPFLGPDATRNMAGVTGESGDGGSGGVPATATGGAPGTGGSVAGVGGAGGGAAPGGQGGAPAPAEVMGGSCPSDPASACLGGGGTVLYLWKCLGTDCTGSGIGNDCSVTDYPNVQFPLPEPPTICIAESGGPGGGLLVRRWANVGYPCRTDKDCGTARPGIHKAATCSPATKTCKL